MNQKVLLEQLKRLVIKEKKALTSKEVLEISHQLDQFVLKDMYRLNQYRKK